VVARLERATQIGAELIVEAGGDVAAAIDEWTSGVGATVVVDATGAPSAIRSAVDLVAPAGRIVLIGISQSEVSLPIVPISRKELAFYGSRNSAGIFGEAVRIVREHQAEVASLITQQISLDEVQQTIEMALEHPEAVEKAIVRLP
jgi:L-gulonate 5-dehydrogenase